MPLIIDAHEDIAFNMMIHGRDYRLPVAETRHREAEAGGNDDGESLLGWPEYQRGQVAVIFSTLFAAPYRKGATAFDRLVYRNPEQAHQLYWQQLETYHRLAGESPDRYSLIYDRGDLASVLEAWKTPVKPNEDPEDTRPTGHPIGLVVLMEGADGIRGPSELPEWWQAGLRIIGLAWTGTRYSGGTREPGPITLEGRELLDAMADIGFALDISHMDSVAALQALERYPRTVIASHANPVGMLKGSDSNRHLPDPVIDLLFERDGVVGVVPYNRFLLAHWSESDGKNTVGLDVVANHIDYYCQRAGDSAHVALGTDFDGGFGRSAVPAEIDTIADLQKLTAVLTGRGYSPADIDAIFHGNWLHKLNQVLPG